MDMLDYGGHSARTCFESIDWIPQDLTLLAQVRWGLLDLIALPTWLGKATRCIAKES